jgi:GAF domain-containing protein
VFDKEKETMKMKQVYDWSRQKQTDDIPGIDVAGDGYYYCNDRSGIYPVLQAGILVKGSPAHYHADLQGLFDEQKVKSVLIVPILDPNEHTLWGFTGFADYSDNHSWTKAEETVVSMLANNIGGAVRRYMSQHELKEAIEFPGLHES